MLNNKSVIFETTNFSPPLTFCNIPLNTVNVSKILGLNINADLKWGTQVAEIRKKANGRLFMLKTLRRFNLPRADLVTIFTGFLRPLVEFAAPVWHSGITAAQNTAVENIQKRACKIIMGKDYTTYEEVLAILNLETLEERRKQLCLSFFKSLLSSEQFCNWVPPLRTNIPPQELEKLR